MGFSERFELLEPLVTSEAQTFAAKERRTGKRVLIHFLSRSKRATDECGLTPVLLSQPSNDLVIEAGECEDPSRLYAVTEMPSDEDMERGWLNARTQLPASEAVTGPIDNRQLRREQQEPTTVEPKLPISLEPEADRSAFSGLFAGPLGGSSAGGSASGDSAKVGGQTGDFTRMWDASTLRAASSHRDVPSSLDEQTPATAEPPSASEPGEFTRIIQGSPLSPAAAETSASDDTLPPPPSKTASERDNEPGEFTRMFNESPLTESAKPGGNSGSGSFTRLFSVQPGAVTSFDPAKASPTEFFRTSAPADNDLALPPAKEPSGSFSMILKAPLEGSGADKPVSENTQDYDSLLQNTGEPARPSSGAATQLFVMPKDRDRETKSVASAEDLGPSEFTRVISASQMRDAEARAVAPSPAAGASTLPPIQMGSAAPVLNMPQVTAPSVTPPSVTPPSITPPSITPPSMSAGGFTAPSVQAPSMSAPSFSSPSVYAPSMSAPSINTPSFSTPSPTQAPAPATVPKQFLYMVLSINVLFLIAVALIVYFVVKR